MFEESIQRRAQYVNATSLLFFFISTLSFPLRGGSPKPFIHLLLLRPPLSHFTTHCEPPAKQFYPPCGIHAHPFRPTATEPPGLQATHRNPGRDCPEAEVYIVRSSSYSSNTDSNRSSSQLPGHKLQTEPAKAGRHVALII